MFRVFAVTALAAVAAAQSPELQSNDGSINVETREGETALETAASARHRRNRARIPPKGRARTLNL